MCYAEVIFAVATLVFAITLAIPIGLFAYRPSITGFYGKLLLWLYLPPGIIGAASVIAGIAIVVDHLLTEWPSLVGTVLDLLAIISIVAVAVLLPYALIKYNRFIVERALESMYEDTIQSP